MGYKLGLLSKEIEHVQQILKSKQSSPISPLNVDRSSYLDIIYGTVKHFMQFQDETGSIIDPYAHIEIQYSTPCFALAAAVLYHSGRYPNDDFLSPSIRALERSLEEVITDTAAQNHNNYYIFPAMQAHEILQPYLTPEKQASLKKQILSISRESAYKVRTEWTTQFEMLANLASVAGEFLRHPHTNNSKEFVEENLGVHIKSFSQAGLHLEPQVTMAFDHYLRYLLVSMIHRGYNWEHKATIEEFLENASWVSLMMQTSSGELPLGGRGSQRLWGEALQCVTFEIWAIWKYRKGDIVAAKAFKRAARLSLKAMLVWLRPSGELYIVKNRFEPDTRHGFETYSFHSHYNMKAVSLLAEAYMFADDSIPEGPTPCELGGFVFTLPFHHKTFANCSGLYVEIDTGAEERFDSTGLIRIHKKGVDPLIGPSAVSSIVEFPVAIGIGWQKKSGDWNFLAQFAGSVLESLTVEEQSTKKVSFALMYTNLENDSIRVRETYTITPTAITVKAQVVPTVPRIKFRFPVMHSDGQNTATLDLQPNTITILFKDCQQVVQLIPPSAPIQLKVIKEKVPYVNGYLNIVEGDIEGNEITYTITPSRITGS